MASDYRSHGEHSTNSQSQHSPDKSYSNAIAKKVRPKREQAVIVESIEGCSNDDYIDGIEKLTDITTIRFISKISGGRVCIYVASDEIVDKLVNKKIHVKDHMLMVRSFIVRNKRVVISNVNPSIPDEILLDALKNKGINPVSSFSDIRASLTKPGRAHILSFRRQVYIKEDDESKLPDSLQILFENTTYWIYLSTDSTCCFICKQNGHIAKLCPNVNATRKTNSSQENKNTATTINTDTDNGKRAINPTGNDIQTNDKQDYNRPQSSSALPASSSPTNQYNASTTTTHSSEETIGVAEPIIKGSDINKHQHNTDLHDERDEMVIDNINIGIKRTRSEASSNNTGNSSSLEKTEIPGTKKQITKKKKSKLSGTKAMNSEEKSKPEKNLEEMLAPVESTLNDPNSFMDYLQMKSFIEKATGSPFSRVIALEYTKDIDGLITLMREIYPQLESRCLKNRFTRIMNKLKLTDNCTTSDDTSD